MNKRIAEKYHFNLDTGHYEYVNEAGPVQQAAPNHSAVAAAQQATAANQQTDQEEGAVAQAAPPMLPNIETPAIVQMKNARDMKLKQFDLEIQKLQEQLGIMNAKLSDATEAFQKNAAAGADVKTTSVTTIQKQIILVQIKLQNKIFDRAKVLKDDTINIYNAQSKLLESQIILPGKYKNLNESNIHMAKIYINTLVGDEEWHLLHGMVDVKKTFGNSNLLYGKDKKGYFAVCIDQEDFDRMYNALQEIGYTRDIIIDAIMPQIFDRGDFIKNS